MRPPAAGFSTSSVTIEPGSINYQLPTTNSQFPRPMSGKAGRYVQRNVRYLRRHVRSVRLQADRDATYQGHLLVVSDNRQPGAFADESIDARAARLFERVARHAIAERRQLRIRLG